MKLTLRNLLAYLDDTLDTEQTVQVGRLLAENEGLRHLVERLREVTRRRRITAPGVKAGDSTHNPNTVAAFLDNELTTDEAAAFEKAVLGEDVELAEVAACHQILATGKAEPVLVPPSAHQRMYALVKGPESIPNRPVVRPALAAEHALPEMDGAADDEEALMLLDPLWQQTRQRWAGRFVPLAAAVLFLILAGIFYFVVRDAGGAKPVAQNPSPSVMPTTPSGPEGTPTAPPASPRLGDVMIGTFASFLASRPALPANALAIMVTDDLAAAATPATPAGNAAATPADQPGTPPATPPAQPATPAPAFPAPVNTKMRVGLHAAEMPKEGLLLRRVSESDWKLVRPQADVLAGELLLVPPGFRNEISLDTRMKLSLVGTLPSVSGANYFFESAVILHGNDDMDLDLTLDRGRIYIVGKPQTPSKVRLRLHDTAWDLVLEPGSEIGLETTGRVMPGGGPWVPHTKLAFFVIKGSMNATRGGTAESVGANRILVWDSVYTGSGPGTIVPLSDPAAWLTKKATYAKDVTEALAAFQKRLQDKLVNVSGSELNWMRIACDEALSDRRPWERIVALFTLGALDQLPSVVAALDDVSNPDLRRAALDVVLHWLGRTAERQQILTRVLVQRGYNQDDAALLLSLLRRSDQPDRATVESLVAALRHDRLAIRELAYLNLFTVAPPERMGNYDPTAPADVRDRQVEAIKARLLK